jgi:hypothetical protein
VSPSESLKDCTDVGLLTEDPLTGHMPRLGKLCIRQTITRKANTQFGWTVVYMCSRLA